MLRGFEYKSIYRSRIDNFDADFMIPSYSRSIKLDRGAGYFTLSSLIWSIDGIIRFIENGGRMRLICSPELSSDDVKIIELGNSLTYKHVTRSMLNQLELDNEISDEDIHKLDIICNMIADGNLSIKVAFMPIGKYHEKFGIFTDREGNKVHYMGSANETLNALVHNQESFTVKASWESEKMNQTIQEEEMYFQSLWDDNFKDISVIPFPDVVQHNLFKLYKKSNSVKEAIDSYYATKLQSGKRTKNLYPYQKEAIKEFLENDGRHFYEMATGTGKTFTAIRTIKALSKFIQKPLLVIICVPQIDLQAQWRKALIEDGYDNINLFGGISHNTEAEITDALIKYSFGDDVICVSTYDTFFARVYDQLKNLDNVFLIVDEAHNLTPRQISNLPTNIKYRLGLSATIQRFSESETNTILDFFANGDTKIKPFYYGLEDAIENNFLSHYNYYPIKVRLEEDEFERYQRKTLLIATEMGKKESDRDYDLLNKTRTERSLIIKKATNKLDKLREMTIDNYDFVNSVVYCGQGKDHEEPIIDSVTKILYEADLSVHTFTSKTEDRPRVLEEFERGYFDTLVAIKCFDEGVDVPKLDKIYIMASDTALRQTVQRRGRVLRKCKESGKTVGFIYDMVAFPPRGYYTEMGTKSLVVNELRRVQEYMRLADNKAEGNEFLAKAYEMYSITESDFSNEDN